MPPQLPMWSTTTDYAIRAVLVLAQSDLPRTAEAVARSIGAPVNYLAKTLNTLAHEGILKSTRGPLGGFSLDVPSDTLTLGRIISVFEEPRRDVRCLLRDSPCNPAAPCQAHERWQQITRSTREALATTSIASLLAPTPV